MISEHDESGKLTAIVTLLTTILFVLITVIPYFFGLLGLFYFVIMSLLGIAFTYYAVRFFLFANRSLCPLCFTLFFALPSHYTTVTFALILTKAV